LHIIPFIIAIIILSWNVIYALLRRRVAGAFEFAVYIFAELLWILGYTFEVLSSSIEGKLFWDDFQWACVFFVAFGYALFVSRYVSGLKYSRTLTIRLSFIILPLILFSISDSLHHMIRSNVRLEMGDSYDRLVYELLWGSYLISGLSYAVTFFGITVLMKKILQSQRELVKQSATILIGISIPIIGSSISLLGITFYGVRDTTPVTFSLGSIVVLWGLFKYGLFDLVPVALRTVLDTIDEAVLVFDVQRRVIFINDAGSRGLGVGVEEVLGKTAKEIFPRQGDSVNYFKDIDQADEEIKIINRHGVKEHYRIKMLPLMTGDSQGFGRVIVLSNITKHKKLTQELQLHKEKAELLVEERTAALEQRNQELMEEVELRLEAEEQIKANLEEKTILVHEMNHRVRNNMTIIMSLLNLQTKYLDSSASIKPIMEIHNRIHSMALIHAMMYHTGNFKHVSINDYLYKLYSKVIHQKRENLNLEFKVEMDQITLPIDKAIPLGLIFNEVITNSIVHAFPALDKGMIRVSGELLEDNIFKFSIFDNGVGFKVRANPETESFGLKIMHLLTEQLEGDLTINANEGTEVTLCFQKSRVQTEPENQEELL